MVAVEASGGPPMPKECNNWRLYYCTAVACIAAIAIGYDSAFIGTSIANASFKKEFNLTNKTTAQFSFLSANIVSTYQAGSFFGAFAGYPTGFYLGRKWGLVLCGVIFVVGSVLQVVASGKTGLGIMYAGRIILGFGIGIASNLTPIYVAEISPAAIRGRMIGMYEMGWQIGSVVGFFINYGVTLHVKPGNVQWLIPFAVQLIPAGALTIMAIFIKESPRWLASKDRNEDALDSLVYFRQLSPDHPYVADEFESITAALEADRAAAGAGFFGPARALFSNRALVKRLLIACSLFGWQNGTGINAINYYSPTVFRNIGVTGLTTGLLSTGIYGLLKFALAVVWLLLLVDRFGRRQLIMIGSAGGAASMYYIAAYIKIKDPVHHPTKTLSSGGKSALAAFYIWTCFYAPTWNGTPWVFGAEVFPTFVRSVSQAFVAASNWFFAFCIARATPYAFAAIGYIYFIIFATMMVLSIPYVYFIVPETKQIPLERMDELFATKPVWRANGIVLSTSGHGEAAHQQQPLDQHDGSDLDEKEKVYHSERA